MNVLRCKIAVFSLRQQGTYYLLCSGFGAPRQNQSTPIEKYRSAACAEPAEAKANELRASRAKPIVRIAQAAR
jgi:hypothetical protein